MMTAAARKTGPLRHAPPAWRQYASDTRQPLYCLLFLFPFAATYEFGALLLRPAVTPSHQLVAHSLIQRLLGWFGGSGFWVPAAALVTTLIAWHLLARYPWRIRGWVLPLMGIESIVLTAPLLVLAQVMLVVGRAGGADLRQQVVLALGAGVYEELVFRLYLISGLTFLLHRLLRVGPRVTLPLLIATSAAVFSVCHFLPIGSESFGWQQFTLRLVAGAYLALVFVGRGLGVAAGCHAAFNLICVLRPLTMA